MARGRRRGRNTRGNRNRSNGNRRRNSNTNRPLVMVRPKNYRHTKLGHGTTSFNARRKFTSYVKNPESGKGWVFDGLSWAGRLVMSLLGIKTTTSILELTEIVPSSEIQRMFPRFGLDQTAEIFNPTGAFLNMKIGPEDLLAEHPTAKFVDGDTSFGNYIPYEEGLIEWLSISVHPGVSQQAREGQIAMAIQPVPLDIRSITAGSDGLPVPPASFHQIMSMPKSVCGDAARPLTITWSPSIRDAGSMWRVLGGKSHYVNDTNQTLKAGKSSAAGGIPSCVWYLAYSAHGDGLAGSSHYAPSIATFSVFLDGRVRLRTPTEDSYSCRAEPWGTFKLGTYLSSPRGSPTGNPLADMRVLDPNGRRILLLNSEQSTPVDDFVMA